MREEAASYIKGIQWEQGYRAKSKEKETKEQENILIYLSKATGGSSATDITSVSKTILALKKRLLPDTVALPLQLNETLFVLQEAIAIGIWAKDSYYDASGLSDLIERKATLTPNQRHDLEAKMQTATAFMLFSLASYIVTTLKERTSETVNVMKNKFAGIPELSLNLSLIHI